MENTESVRFNVQGFVWPPTRFGAESLWLDSKEQKKPILKFDCFSNNGYLTGNNVIVVFPHGITGRAVIQSFAYGLWGSSNICGQDNRFDQIGEDGLLQIRSQQTVCSGDISQPDPVIYKWNGKEFAPIAEELKTESND